MLDVLEIVKAWAISFNPTKDQFELAQKRYNICRNCKYIKKLPKLEICEICKCPINKKIFAVSKSQWCPKEYWDVIK
jgi:hypothetical protein